MMVDGGYAEFVIAKAAYVAPLPTQMSYIEAAPGTRRCPLYNQSKGTGSS
jgi:D-arabinose 1-dehydrogenase-like Zn-dependent alcohol dehydrogenase